MTSRVLQAEHPTRGALWAAIDPSVRFIEGEIRESRFAARLAPFPDETSARHALLAAGALLPERVR